MTLEQTLDELSKYARPYLNQHEDNTWSCSAVLRVNVKGSDFKVRSDFNHPTATAAASTCLCRVRAMLKDIHKMAPQVPHNRPGVTYVHNA